jgi:hypothetical protein
MFNDSPPPSWYEPLDDIEADDVEREPVEDLAILSGIVCWHAGVAHD